MLKKAIVLLAHHSRAETRFSHALFSPQRNPQRSPEAMPVFPRLRPRLGQGPSWRAWVGGWNQRPFWASCPFIRRPLV